MDIGTLTGQIEIEDHLSSVIDYSTGIIKTFASEMTSMISTLGPAGAGFATAAGAVAGFGVAVVTATGAITASIIALGNRGSDVNDVADTFEHFSGSVEVADESMRKMRDGVKGTVTDFDLMKSASKLLAAEAKLTSDQFGTLTKAAFVLQNQGLGDTKEMLDLVSQALLTGRTRSLEMKIGRIDLKKAEEEFAASLGGTRTQLTQAGKLEADRTAILEALNKKVQEAGVQQRDFGETMDAAVVFIKNWGDELSSRVAESPHVTAALHNIEEAINKAFGTESQSLLETAVSAIDKFADIAAEEGPKIIDFISEAITKTKELYGWLEKWQKIMSYITPGSSAAPMDAAAAGSAAASGGIKGVFGRMMTSAMAAQAAAANSGITEFNAPTTFNNSKPPKANEDLLDQRKELIKLSKEMVKRIDDETKMEWKNALALKSITNTLHDNVAARRKELNIYPPLAASYAYNIEAMKDQRTWIEKNNDSLSLYIYKMGKEATESNLKASSIIDQASAALARQEAAAARTREIWSHVADSTSLAADILDQIPNKYAKIASEALRSASAIINAYETGGVYNAIATAAVEGVKWIVKLFGATDYEKRTRQAAADMQKLTFEAEKAAGGMKRLELNAKMVGIYIKGAFDSKDPKFLSQVLDEVKAKTERLNAAMEEYGFTWMDLGQEYRAAQLNDKFADLYDKTQLLKGAGIDYGEILRRQASQYTELLEAAVTTGTEIPMAMKKPLEDLISMGIIVGDDAEKFKKELGEVSWSKTMTQGFEDVTKAIYDLRDALIDGVGGAIDNISGKEVVIKTRIDRTDIESGIDVEEPSYYASGGRVIAFRAKGSDTVPAMLTPGERVIPRGGAGGGKVVVELNGRVLAETVVPEIPGAVKRMGLGR